MGQLSLSRLRTFNFMRYDRTLSFGPVNYIVGGNGAGKSEVIEALSLLATGSPIVTQAHVDDIMLLSRDGTGFVIEGEFLHSGSHDVGGGLVRGDRVATAGRSWKRDPESHKVSNPIKGTMLERGMRQPEAKSYLNRTLGGWRQSWTPLDLRRGGAQLRKDLIQLLGGGAGLRVEDYLPPDAPPYLRPLDDTEGVIDEWAQGALRRARAQAAKTSASLEETEAQIRALETAGTVAPDTTRITEALAALRSELAAIEAQAAAEKEAARLVRALEDARARLAKLGPKPEAPNAAQEALERLLERRIVDTMTEVIRDGQVKAAVEARALEVTASRALDRHRGADVFRDMDPSALTRQLSGVLDTAKALPESEEKWRAEAARLNALALEERDARDRAKAVRDQLAGVRLHYAECPRCSFDLAGDTADRLRAQEKILADMEENLRRVSRDHDTATKRLLGVAGEIATNRQILQAIEAVIAWREADEAARTAEAAVKPLPSEFVSEAMVKAARAAVDAAKKAAELRRTISDEVGRLDLDSEMATARSQALLSVLTKTRAQVETEIEIQQSKLEEAGAATSRVEDYAEAHRDRKVLIQRLSEERDWVTRMEAAEGQVLGSIKRALEEPCSELMGVPVTVELVDARGNPDCRIKRGTTDMATLSKGEAVLGGLAVLRALGPTSGASWRVVCIDEFESVERAMRGRVFAALHAAIAAGEIDQAFVSGCPDIIEPYGDVQPIVLVAA